jgi:(1->4)-alpha-D-glucan 1-alpha-D-glucosylmutase
MTMPDLPETIIPAPRIPRATYRLQVHHEFTFADAQAIVPYLAALGISDAYTSPILQARPGSLHGYDICDHSRINPELGGEEGFAAFSASLQAHGMGLLLDVVPNHMGINIECNAWWMDVLENGPSSIYARMFDIDWHPLKAESENKVLLPILGEHYGQALENGALRLAYDNGAFTLHIYDTLRLPIAPRTYRALLGFQVDQLKEQLGAQDAAVQEIESIITALDHLPPPDTTDAERVAERNREKEVTKRRIAALMNDNDAVRAAIETTVQTFNGTPGDPHSFDMLDDLIAHQSYRPAYWRVAAEEINYRRFFDVDELAAIQVERPDVFEATHQVIFRLLAAGQVTGLRIDHPDGLWDPAQYFRQVQERFVRDHAAAWLRVHAGDDAQQAQATAAIEAWRATLAESNTSAHEWPLYIVVEKILSEREPLPLNWPVAGTTGYDFLNDVNDLLLPRENEGALTAIYQSFLDHDIHYDEQVRGAKWLIMTTALTSEINTLGRQLQRITERNRRYRDYTLYNIIAALREVIAAFRVYRTYITADGPVAERDATYITLAVAEARRRKPEMVEGLFDFLEAILLLRNLDQFREEDRPAVIDFVMKLQQVTGPIMAKSLEDTTFYSYNRLVSVNEVGGNPEQLGISALTFHEQNAARAARWPHTLLASTTHDTKRSEDMRARIDVLAELPDEWAAALERWRGLVANARQPGQDNMPATNDEYLLYQTLLGVWPFGELDDAALADLTERVQGYMEKAVSEAKVHTSWTNPNQAYMDALRAFVAALLAPGDDHTFLRDFLPFQRRVAYFGQWNSLAQTLLKLASPGVPDFYQGTELWSFTLVDPDNRRPVDYALRQRLLTDLQGRLAAPEADRRALCQELLADTADGRIKLYIIQAALSLRRDQPDLFANGGYRGLEARGDRWHHVCAMAREGTATSLIALAPRLTAKLTSGAERPPIGQDIWHDTWLTLPDAYAGRHYRDAFTGQTVAVGERDGVPCLAVADLLADFPVALLVQEPTSPRLKTED